MMNISYKELESSTRGKVLWQTACLALIWVVWREKNTKIFWDKAKTSEGLWDIIHLFASFWSSCIIAFKDIPLIWFSLTGFWCVDQKGLGIIERRLART